MLRRSELAALTVGCVEYLPSGGIGLRIAKSKTDQKGTGALVCLGDLTKSGVPIARIVERHLGFVGGRGSEAPLFDRGSVWPTRRAGGWQRGDFTDRLRFLLGELQCELPELQLDLSSISAHSLRRGGATAAANAGISLEEIKEHGWWKSDAVLAYIRKSIAVRRAVVERM